MTAPRVETVDDIVAALTERQPENRVEARLEPTRRALDLLGDPQASFRMIHVTGTNGKTSTSRIAASILRSYGLGVGLFTSPHLVRFTERIDIGGEPIADARLVDVWNDIAPYLDMVDRELAAEGRARLTYFEALTVLAYAAFADAPVDVAVVEVGMGGLWDSTNVADADVAAFAPIALDHTDRLGASIAEIAETKAGILKGGSLAVSAEQTPEARAQLDAAAAALGSEVWYEGERFEVIGANLAVGGQQLDVRGLAGTYRELLLPLIGDHQAHNAALAIAAVEAFLGGGDVPLKQDVLEQGLLAATSPGRLQRIAAAPAVVVDVAHNPHGAKALADSLADSFGFERIVGVVGILAEKDARGILEQLAGVLDTIIVTEAPSPRAIGEDELRAVAEEAFGPDRVRSESTVAGALLLARELVENEPTSGVLVTGSVTTVGGAMRALADGWDGLEALDD